MRTIELKGRIAELSGGCPTWTFKLAGRAVYTTAATTYERGPCKNMSNEKEIEVRGVLLSDDRVRADTIRYDRDDDDDDGEND